jgi:hypothetical protein
MGVMVSATLRPRAPTSRYGRAEKRGSQASETTLNGLRGQKMTGVWHAAPSATGGAMDARRGRMKVSLFWLPAPSWLKGRRDLRGLSILRSGWPELRVPDGELASAPGSCGDGGDRDDFRWTMVLARVPGGDPPWAAAWSSFVGWARLICVVVGNACVWSAATWAWASWAFWSLNMQRPACACRGSPISTLDNLGFLISYTYLPRRLVYLPPSCFQSRSCGGGDMGSPVRRFPIRSQRSVIRLRGECVLPVGRVIKP